MRILVGWLSWPYFFARNKNWLLLDHFWKPLPAIAAALAISPIVTGAAWWDPLDMISYGGFQTLFWISIALYILGGGVLRLIAMALEA